MRQPGAKAASAGWEPVELVPPNSQSTAGNVAVESNRAVTVTGSCLFIYFLRTKINPATITITPTMVPIICL